METRRRSSRIAKLVGGIEESVIVKEEPKVKKKKKEVRKRTTKIKQPGPQPKKRSRGNAKEEDKEENTTIDGSDKIEVDEEDPAVEVSIEMDGSIEEGEKMDEVEVPSPVERPGSRMDRPRRSVASRRVSYATPVPKDDDEMITMSSSSSSDAESSSDDELGFSFSVKAENSRARRKSEVLPEKGRAKPSTSKRGAVKQKKDEESEDSSSSFESDSEKGKKKKKKKRRGRQKKQSGKDPDEKDMNWPKCSKASIERKTGNPGNSKTVKSGLRAASKTKPDQPWKKNLADYEKERKMAKGEQRMREYRIIAAAYARGKIAEVSYDECYKVHEEMKKAYHEGRKLMEAIDKKEREEESGEKESSSEDEWEDLEHFEPVLDERIEVTLEMTEEDVEKDWWVVYFRQEVNKRIRAVWEATHKTHLLCYMYHLNFVVKTSLDEHLISSLMLSQLPSGYLRYVGERLSVDVLEKLLKWYTSAFRPLNGNLSVTSIDEGLKEGQEARYPATTRLSALVTRKCFETDLDRATLLFCLLAGMEATARICVNVQAISRKWDKEQQEDLKTEMEDFLKKARSKSPEEEVEPKKEAKGKKKAKKEERNYWVEYWDTFEKRWICLDPLSKEVDEPLKIQNNATAPLSYVFAIDNKRGVCDVTQRYALDFVKQEFRRRRTDQGWISNTLRKPFFSANEERRRLEKMQMHEELVKRPLPTTMSEFKNHPIYVLEKDLLKYEAIYPPVSSQKPLGNIRGHNVYPRSCVYTLMGENNWLKLARSVKIGETPYKMVKARPNPKVPKEERVESFLEVFGYWQTEPYRRPKVEKGKIPCNSYGNVYMFHESMCPIGCAYLKLSGLVQISRKLGKECVPAVVGWAFDGGWTHPVISGAVVLEKDAEIFVKEWERIEAGRAEKEKKVRTDKVLENWKRLIKGKLRLNYVRQKFGAISKINKQKEQEDEHEGQGTSGSQNQENVDEVIDNSKKMKPIEGFSLDDFVKSRI